ncbi:hypothetical protein [Nesterenkonia rhizosphaerae]|uniref:Antitoxin n=1 Tax=Nesterenkonia rhizosphaerae TaxID=1348272 RepID=A0ABP9FTM1_9MICC
MKNKPNPSLMSARELEDAIDEEMERHPDGSDYATKLIDEYERRS